MGASCGNCGKPATMVVTANWLCVEPWVTARSAVADTFFPLVSGKALLSLLLRPQPVTEPHMPGRVGQTRQSTHPYPRAYTPSREADEKTQHIVLALGGHCDHIGKGQAWAPVRKLTQGLENLSSGFSSVFFLKSTCRPGSRKRGQGPGYQTRKCRSISA